MSSPWKNTEYRIIEFENKCNYPIGVVTTRASGIKMPCSQICNSELINGGIINTAAGGKCKNFKQIKRYPASHT